MLEFSFFKLDLEELPQIVGEFIEDIILESLVLEFTHFLFRAVAAIGALLAVRETVETAVAVGFCGYVLEIDDYALQPGTNLFLESVALQLPDQLLVVIKIGSRCHYFGPER